uniref:Uncharacterized protein n=1 Tax=Siphoviridae sp. ctMOb8 TaxID=2825460 RepID=A0A8S5PYL8_9CAUD|nr:MAG TPA: hypothetical protein [Siphoviridae sp. ctMOb8]
MRSKVGNEGREIVADILCCVTPRRYESSFCVIPNIFRCSFIYTFILISIYYLYKGRLFNINTNIYLC